MERNDELQARWGQAAIDALDQAVGKITRVECYADGIYYIGAHKEDSASCFAAEYYVVENDTKIISAQAKAYGTPIEGCSDLLLFQAEVEGKGFEIIEFELARYRVANHIPLDPLESPYDIALFAAEDYPDYFGPYPAPTVTPFGNLLRYISLENGIIWMETDGEGWALALSYPIWASDLTPLAIALGKQTERDAALGIEKTMGYLFFSERDSCIPLFELLVDHPALQKAEIIDFAALMNAIWVYHPQYAITANVLEQLGANDFLFSLLTALCPEKAPAEPVISVENMISYRPETGTKFIRL